MNPYILVPIVAWAIAQLSKFGYQALRGNINPHYLYATGGMPSGHSALVTSLAMTSWLIDGTGSHIFGLTAIIAGVVIYDSFGVRLAAGDQAVALNALMHDLAPGQLKHGHPLRVVLGHKPSEVLAGMGIGLVVGLVGNQAQLSQRLGFVAVVPHGAEFWVYSIISLLLVAVSWVGWALARRRFRRSPAMRRWLRRLLVGLQIGGWLGLAAAVVQHESINYANWRLWPWLIAATLAGWILWLLSNYRVKIRTKVAEEQAAARRQQWLDGNTNKKRRRK